MSSISKEENYLKTINNTNNNLGELKNAFSIFKKVNNIF